AIAQLLDFLVEAGGAIAVGGDAFKDLDSVLEGTDFGQQRLGFGVAGQVADDIIMAAAVAPHAIFRADDAADRHDEDDADDHFKGVHGEIPFACVFSLSQFSGVSRSFSISSAI